MSACDFVVWQGVQDYRFDKLKNNVDLVEEMLVVAGLHNSDIQEKVLDKIQASESDLKLQQIIAIVH